jgi:hypothetical protein
MTRKVINTLCLTAVSLFLCCMLGCVTMGHRFYSGPPLPNSEVALVYAISDCRIQFIREEREKEEKHLGIKPQYMLELLPGQYNAILQFGRIREKWQLILARQLRTQTFHRVGQRIQRELNVQAGNIYIIYPEFTETLWRPIIVNINDYNVEECNKYNAKESNCPDKDQIREWATKYLQSERLMMSYHPSEQQISLGLEGVQHYINGVWW